jgi:hypothetical protein
VDKSGASRDAVTAGHAQLLVGLLLVFADAYAFCWAKRQPIVKSLKILVLKIVLII